MIRRFWPLALATVILAATTIALLWSHRERGSFSHEPGGWLLYEGGRSTDEPVRFGRSTAQRLAEQFIDRQWGMPEDAVITFSGSMMRSSVRDPRPVALSYEFNWRREGYPPGLPWGAIWVSIKSSKDRPFVQSAGYSWRGWPDAGSVKQTAAELQQKDYSTTHWASEATLATMCAAHYG